MTAWLLKACQKCGGALYWHDGEGFNCYKCFQCGFMPYAVIPEELPGRRRKMSSRGWKREMEGWMLKNKPVKTGCRFCKDCLQCPYPDCRWEFHKKKE